MSSPRILEKILYSSAVSYTLRRPFLPLSSNHAQGQGVEAPSAEEPVAPGVALAGAGRIHGDGLEVFGRQIRQPARMDAAVVPGVPPQRLAQVTQVRVVLLLQLHPDHVFRADRAAVEQEAIGLAGKETCPDQVAPLPVAAVELVGQRPIQAPLDPQPHW